MQTESPKQIASRILMEGRSAYAWRESTVTVGITGVTKLVSANAERFCLILHNCSNVTAFVSTRQTVAVNNGFVLGFGGILNWVWVQHGVLAMVDWFAIAMTSPATFVVLEAFVP